jgi:anti-sigma regulatory factor (Ser/Thr protein kinase)
VAAVLGCAGWPDETRDDVTLAVDEAVQNAVEHGSTPAAPIEVELVLTHDVVDITVRDRGRLIIASLADEAVWGPGDGAEVRLRFERDAQR